jgi:hypothetical protein
MKGQFTNQFLAWSAVILAGLTLACCMAIAWDGWVYGEAKNVIGASLFAGCTAMVCRAVFHSIKRTGDDE